MAGDTIMIEIGDILFIAFMAAIFAPFVFKLR